MGGTCVPATFHKLPSQKVVLEEGSFYFSVREGRLCKHWFVSKAENRGEQIIIEIDSDG